MIKLLPSIYKFIFSSHLAPNYFVMFCNDNYYSQKKFHTPTTTIGEIREREADALLLTQLDIMIIIIKTGGGRE